MEEVLRQIEEIANMTDSECEEIEDDFIEHRQAVAEFLNRMGLSIN